MSDLPVRSARERDRAAMRRVLADAGFGHAAASVATAVAVAVTPSTAGDDDLGKVADMAENVLLDAAVYFARSHGWKPPR